MVKAGIVTVLITLILVSVWHGELNQDEGWYLYAARMVSRGEVLYKDFTYTQPPVLPLVYAYFQPYIAWQGLFAGRSISTLCSCLAVGLTCVVAYKFYGSVWLTLLLFINPFYWKFMTEVKGYSLTALFMMAAVMVFSVVPVTAASSILVGVLLAAMAGTRLITMVLVPVFIGAYLFLGKRRYAGDLLFGFVGMSMFIFLPYLAQFYSRCIGCMVSFHYLRIPGNISGVVQLGYFFLQAPLLLIGLVWAGIRFSHSLLKREVIWRILCVAGVAAHLLVKMVYPEYFVIFYPLLVLIIVTSIPLYLRHQVNEGLKWGVLISLLLLVLSPIPREWVVYGQDRCWIRTKEKSDLAVLRDVGRKVKGMVHEGDRIMTFDTYLAIEADRDVVKGFEMGPFSFTSDEDPGLPDGILMDKEEAIELIKKREAPVVALSGYSFSVNSPEIARVGMDYQRGIFFEVVRNYKNVFEVPDFGQQHTRLSIYERR